MNTNEKMDKTSVIKIWITLQLLLSCICYAQPSRLTGYSRAPIIEPSTPDVTYSVYSSAKLECKSDKPITWISEKITKDDENIAIKTYQIDSTMYDKDVYRSTLEFQEITTIYVAKYYCIHTEVIGEIKKPTFDYSNEVNSLKASSIYIYVDDPDVLLVQVNDMFINVYQHQNFTVPCKPTSKSVNVKLMHESEEPLEIVHSDPQVGITINVKRLEDSGTLDCSVEDNVEAEPIQFHLMVHEDYDNVKGKRQLGNRANGMSMNKTLTIYLGKPVFASTSNFLAIEHEPFVLQCIVNVTLGANYELLFLLPNQEVAETNDRMAVSNLSADNLGLGHVNLTIHKINKFKDEGEYTCLVRDHKNNTNTNFQTVKVPNEPYVKLSSITDKVETKFGKKQVTFMVEYDAFPSPTFHWYNNYNEKISNEAMVLKKDKYDVKINVDTVKLTIKSPDLADFGFYTLEASTMSGIKETIKLKLLVSDKPTVVMEEAYIQPGEEVTMSCLCVGYPAALITWSFRPCHNVSQWPECGTATSRQFSEEAEFKQSTETAQTSEIRFIPLEPGFVTCKARNDIGRDSITKSVLIGDLKEVFQITGMDEDQKVAVGDEVTLECGAVIYNYSSNLHWNKNFEQIVKSDVVTIVDSETKYSWRKTISWKSVAKHDEGSYDCQVYPIGSDLPEIKQITLRVFDPEPPIITANFNDSFLKQAIGEPLRLECFTTGLPVPMVKWYKNNEEFFIEDNSTRISFINDNMTLDIQFLTAEDAGHYKCVGWNRIGTDSKTIELEIPNSSISKGIIIGVVSLILLLMLLSIYLCARVHRERKLIKELKAAGLANFEEGNLECIDPDIGLDEQADLLPYDKHFEFPREKLKLGKQLGAGAFGVVVKAQAQGIVAYEDETTVAVKMVKKQTDNEVMKALVSELKIMVHLGQHLNVVNLLGAVTKNIAKREVMVIVEYCRFGNLQSFLIKHRPYFVDQIVKETDAIDHTVQKNELRWSKHSAYNVNSQGLKYISVSFANDKPSKKQNNYINENGNHYINCSDGNDYTRRPGGGVVNAAAHMNSKGYVRHSGIQNQTVTDSCNTEATMVSSVGQEESIMLSNNSDQPLWRSNYGMDYKGPARNVNTSDLVCWSFQVARGMDYLSSRKVLHGDLAARNILLSDDNVVKICDFGLARSMYKNDNYKKKGDAPLPFKWLALESISDHMFSTYSDVWSFGVVLWELFSLGKVPYTGIEANQSLYFKLRDGYRMEKPAFANQDIYDIMLNCWNAKPESRPLFNELERRLGALLHENVKDLYVDLNEPYLNANLKNYSEGHIDYLAMQSVPNEDAPLPPDSSAPLYINSTIDPNAPASPEYLSMSPKSGIVRYNNSGPSSHKSDYIRPDSPTITRNLDNSPKHKSKHPNKKSDIPEEIPMLHRNENGLLVHSDSEEESTPHLYTEMTFNLDEPEYKNILNPSGNYINVPSSISPKNGTKPNNDAITNPSYVTFKTVNERVN